MRTQDLAFRYVGILLLLADASCTGGEYSARDALRGLGSSAGQSSVSDAGGANGDIAGKGNTAGQLGGAGNLGSDTLITAGVPQLGTQGSSVGGSAGGCANPVRERIPLVNDLYTADPSARVFDGRIYIYPSHDVGSSNTASSEIDSPVVAGSVDGDQYRMTDYHVYSMDDMLCSAVTDHGQVLRVEDVPWASRQMWAPDAIRKNDTYYLYFPARDRSDLFRIGVATSKTPSGPFIPQAEPLEGSFSIDPAAFVDDDGQAYLYFGGLLGGQLEHWQTGNYDPNAVEPGGQALALGPRVAKLRYDMLGFEGGTAEIRILDERGAPLIAADTNRTFFEGVWVHKFQATYYLSYSTGMTHYLAWATSNSPFGPFTYRGKLLEPVSGWTTHHSILEWRGKWYLFYHDSALSGQDNQRNMKVMEFARTDDGGLPTLVP